MGQSRHCGAGGDGYDTGDGGNGGTGGVGATGGAALSWGFAASAGGASGGVGGNGGTGANGGTGQNGGTSGSGVGAGASGAAGGTAGNGGNGGAGGTAGNGPGGNGSHGNGGMGGGGTDGATGASGVAFNPVLSRAYVANKSMTGGVSVIDTSNDQVVATISVGGGPSDMAVSSDGTRVYVTNSTSGNVSVINTADNTVIGTITVGSNPAALAVSPDGSRQYVGSNGALSVIDTATSTIVATISGYAGTATGVAVSPNGQLVYVVGAGYGLGSVYSTSTYLSVGDFLTYGSPTGVAVAPDGSTLWVASNGGFVEYDLNPASLSYNDDVFVSSADARAIAVAPDGTAYGARVIGGSGYHQHHPPTKAAVSRCGLERRHVPREPRVRMAPAVPVPQEAWAGSAVPAAPAGTSGRASPETETPAPQGPVAPPVLRARTGNWTFPAKSTSRLWVGRSPQP